MPVRDTSLLVTTAASAGLAILGESCRKSGRLRLASSLKTLGRTEEALAKGAFEEADFWLLAGSYDYAYAWLYSKEVVPAPSHLLRQTREVSTGASRAFEAFARGISLERSGRASCEARLDGIGILHDIRRGRGKTGENGHQWPSVALSIVSAKAGELEARVEHAECYSFLGQELVKASLGLTSTDGASAKQRSEIGSLFGAKSSLLSGRVLRDLGIPRSEETISRALELVRREVSLLAKRL
jgi:hypothetical protein